MALGRSLSSSKIIRQCLPCLRARPPVPEYTMGSLLATRVKSHYPSIYPRRGRLLWPLLLKAVHLEVVSDLTTEAFIGALRRFISRRGRPATIQSDNGTNFVGANNELKQIVTELQHPNNNHKITSELTPRGIDWQFSPAQSPHFGGIWEAAVKSFKHRLRRVMGTQLLTLEHFSTFMVEIEGILHSRELYPSSTDPNDLQVLTPGHFLIGEELTRPSPNMVSEKSQQTDFLSSNTSRKCARTFGADGIRNTSTN
ncbi:uncharacterized protein LOC135171051 [Diachasmimorpha longicaudata]|uniref:uncharacterized protein LOC135171051 n=1 Tax=Diachasmimorpha longicaudata TaxID=58733 RepID=UPI0030B901BA